MTNKKLLGYLESKNRLFSGSCALNVVIFDKNIHVINVGDSKAILSIS